MVRVFVIKHLFLVEKLVCKCGVNEWHDISDVITL